MTAITEEKFSRGNLADIRLYKRARIEADEVARLNDWFDAAAVNNVFVAESMGLTASERYTIVRIHQKTTPTELVEHVVTLHNGSVELFDELHEAIGAAAPESADELELLSNMYSLETDNPDFAQEYVRRYDRLLADKNPGRNYNFGLEKTEKSVPEDDIEAVRRQTALRSIYLDNLKELYGGGGRATAALVKAGRDLGCSRGLYEGAELSYELAGEILDRSLQSIVATLERAPKEELDRLAVVQDKAGAYESAGGYGGQARSEGVRYDGACPTGSGAAAAAEAAAAVQAYRHDKDPSRCGTCPRCRKEYFVEETVYKAGIVECDNCHAAIYFGGGAVPKEVLDRLHGRDQKPELGFFDSLMLAVEQAGLEVKVKVLRKRQLSEDLSEFERRHGTQLLREYSEQLDEIKYLTS
jgi:hypothetical protein